MAKENTLKIGSSCVPSDITFSMESGSECGKLIFDATTKKFRFEGDAEESAKVFLNYMQEQFDILNKKAVKKVIKKK